MITKDQAINARVFVSLYDLNADGTNQRWRRNGKTKVWKTRPNEFEVPVKRGLYQYGKITETNAENFDVEE